MALLSHSRNLDPIAHLQRSKSRRMFEDVLIFLGCAPCWIWLVLPCTLAITLSVAAGRRLYRETLCAVVLLTTWYFSYLIKSNISGEWEWFDKSILDLCAGAAFALMAYKTHDRRAIVIGFLFWAQVMIDCAKAADFIIHGDTWRGAATYYWISFAMAWGQVLAFARGVYGKGRRRGISRGHGHIRLGGYATAKSSYKAHESAGRG